LKTRNPLTSDARARSLSRAGFNEALAPSVVQVDELFRLGDVKDDVKPANRLFLRNLKCSFGGPEAFAFGGIFCPLVVTGQIFQLFGVFDQDVHERGCYHILPNNKHTDRPIRHFIFTRRVCDRRR